MKEHQKLLEEINKNGGGQDMTPGGIVGQSPICTKPKPGWFSALKASIVLLVAGLIIKLLSIRKKPIVITLRDNITDEEIQQLRDNLNKCSNEKTRILSNKEKRNIDIFKNRYRKGHGGIVGWQNLIDDE